MPFISSYSFRPWIVYAHLCTVTSGFPNSKKNSFRGKYMRKYGILRPIQGIFGLVYSPLNSVISTQHFIWGHAIGGSATNKDRQCCWLTRNNNAKLGENNCAEFTTNQRTYSGRQLVHSYFPYLALQVNLCQKHLFLHQLTHNMTKNCSLIYQFSTWKLQAQNMCAWIVLNTKTKKQFVQGMR